jgi:endogenous inhibitor of DNA gyrase (YacG/DUF329 family)
MTSQQKARLTEMRQEGLSFAQISADLGVSKNTLKSICRRADADKGATATTVCARCGNPFAVSGKRRFCSDGCRYAWSYSHRILSADNAVEKKCACCGKRFFSYASSHRKYCSRACYIADRYGKEDCHDGQAV